MSEQTTVERESVKHSALPWRVEAGKFSYGDYPVIMATGASEMVATMHNYGQEGGANAALIVEAVNHHAELLATLRGLLAAYEQLEHEAGNDYQEVAAATDARALLAKLSTH